MKTQTKSLKISRNWANWMVFFVLLLLALFLLRFEPVAKAVGKTIGVDPGKLQRFAGTGILLIGGFVFVKWGLVALSVPWIGVPMVIVGLGMMAYSAYFIYEDYFSENKPVKAE